MSVEYFTPGKTNWVEVQVKYDEKLPEHAVETGEENGGKLFVARASFHDDVIPGKFHVGHPECYVAWGGKEYAVAPYEILVDPEQELKWSDSSNGELVPNAVEGGRTSDGELLYVGRFLHNGIYIPGKIQPSHGVCYISYDGKEISCETYQILHG